MTLEKTPDARAYLAAVLATSDDAITTANLDRVITSWNKSAERLYGYPAAEIVGRNVSLLVPDELRGEFASIWQIVLEGGEPQRLETQRVAKDGRRLHVSLLLSAITDASGEVAGVLARTRDLTLERALEADSRTMIEELAQERDRLRHSEQRFRQMADSLPQLIWTAEPDGTIDHINAYFEEYAGITFGPELRSLDALIRVVVHPDEADRVVDAWRHAVTTGESYQYECRARRADGTYRWHLARAVAGWHDGRKLKWYGSATDIQDLRDTQERLTASELKFRWLYDGNIIGVFFWKADGRVTEANDAFCDLVGCNHDECQGGTISWKALTHPDYVARDQEALQEVISGGGCRRYEKAFVNRRTGDSVCVLIAAAKTPGAESDGIAFVVDLTELKRTEEALKAAQSILELAVETTGLGIYEWDLRSGKQRWSKITKAQHGLPPDAEIGDDTLRSVVHPDDWSQVKRVVREACLPAGPGTFEIQYRTAEGADGGHRIASRGRVFFDEAGTPLRIIGAGIDITSIIETQEKLKEEEAGRLQAVEELQRQEQLLMRQGRLAAMGEMIGNIAHQWRQPLNTLGLMLQELQALYQRELLNKEYLDGRVAGAMEIINHMSKTIDGFRNFFAPDKAKESFNVAEVVSRTISLLAAGLSQLNLVIDTDFDRGVEIYGYPNEFCQVVLNILANAKDAIVERGPAEPRIRISVFREDSKAVVTIADNAGGIPAEVFDKIFDPYFTTKGPDRGTGIGLFMSKIIIEKHMDGSLSVHNTAGGAEFRIVV
jgi:PAS domain S-box-containing protein